MARSSKNVPVGSRRKLRIAPWFVAWQAAMVARDHWQSLPATDRARLAELVKQSKLRPSALTPDQRAELVEIVKRTDFKKLGRDLAPIAARNAVRGKTFRR